MSRSREEMPSRVERLKRARIVPVPHVAASAEQRRKVATMRCAVCGRRPVDPAHLVPQRLGGCASPDCVVALCRTHHRLYDNGRLALAPYLGRAFRRERAHALMHAGAAELRRALQGDGWPSPD
jgi:hypothetical protein